MPTLSARAATPPGWVLLSTSCGTAVASVCCLGLFAIESLVGGLWSPLAVAVAGALCLLLSRRVGHLYRVLPSGAGLLAQLSRGLGRRAGLMLVVPYLTLTLLLVGAEATLCGLLLGTLWPLPTPLWAALFLVATWALCRAGLHLGQLAQALSTAALMLGLGALALALFAEAAAQGQLAARLVRPVPSVAALLAAIGQALFLFMGFELVTFQAGGGEPQRVRRVLTLSVGLLTGFYALMSLGISCLPVRPDASALQRSLIAPQLLLAQRGGRPVVLAVVLLSLLASYTSFNGALLTLSRFTYALASQGLLPRGLAALDPRTHVPRRALDGLLGFSLLATSVLLGTRALVPVIVAAAACAAVMYAGVALARERAPFSGPLRRPARRLAGFGLSALLSGLAIGALCDLPASANRSAAVALVLLGYCAAASLSLRLARRAERPVVPAASRPVPEGDPHAARR
ncbi:MAG: amino acid permease [Polyangia bacterium]